MQLCWDDTGESLAMLQQASAVIRIWDANLQAETSFDSGMKDATFIKWASTGETLAVGTAKGNLLLYSKRTTKKQTILGKHTKRILAGAWQTGERLALVSEDKQLTISNAEGDTLLQTATKGEPSALQFFKRASDKGDTTMSVVVAGRSLVVYNTDDGDAMARTAVELTFQPAYGNIVDYKWFGAGHICLGFETGHLVVINCQSRNQAGAELFSCRLHQDGLSCLAVSPLLFRAASCSGSAIHVVALSASPCPSADDPEYRVLPDEGMQLQTDGGVLDRCEWTRDGQILTVSCDSGVVFNFLASLPVLTATHGTRYMYLTSLLELSIFDSGAGQHAQPVLVAAQMEPTFIALGPAHVALGMNNHVSFHSLAASGCPLIAEKEYLGTVDAVKLNREFVAVLSEGRICLDAIAERHAQTCGASDLISRVFPEGKQRDVNCVSLTKELLIYGTHSGSIVYVYLPELVIVSDVRHQHPIASIFPNELGTRLVYFDAPVSAPVASSSYFYSPIDDSTIPVSKLPPSAKGVLWDTADWRVFVGYDSNSFFVYVYTALSIDGPSISQASSQAIKMPGPNLLPVLVHDGSVICQAPSGAVSSVLLPTHSAISQLSQARGSAGVDKIRACFTQTLALGRLARAWDLAAALKHKDIYVALGKACMRCLDVSLAIRAFRAVGDAGTVMALQRVDGLEDVHLLSGHLALIFDDHATAQDHFLQSARPLAALDMRRDLMHWEQALKLAKTLAADQVPFISREFAQQLEFQGQYEQALQSYHKGLGDAAASTGGAWRSDLPHDRACRMGIARMMLRLGDVGRGTALAAEGAETGCCRDCAAILESLKQWTEAAKLYEMGEQPEKAAAIYIKIKHWSAATPLMAKISAPKLHSEYAKAKEAEGRFEDAVLAYEHACDMDSVVRVLVTNLKEVSRSMNIVRETKSPQAALLVAEHCGAVGDQRAAIEFLVLAKRPAEAFDVASTHDEMDAYTAALGGNGLVNENKKVALYYEGKADFFKAGEFWFACKDYSKALRHFLQCGERAVDQAIEVVGRARSDILTHTLIDFLMGETDGVPKDPNYIFRLYMALGNYPQAAKTAIIIARQEQELGNYRVAHGILFETYRELGAQKIRVPQELAANLMLLHSYVLVRPLTKLGDHISAARMLIRVAKHISKFPMHLVPILTSTVIECHKAGLRASAFEYASTLMRPEYRPHLGEAYKRKIEAIVRKPGERTDLEEPVTPSPYDGTTMVAETSLECPLTKNTLPYCVATGRHIVLSELCICPTCCFPALYGPFAALVQSESTCPMCQQVVSLGSIRRMDADEAQEWLDKHLGVNTGAKKIHALAKASNAIHAMKGL